jgi:hypothetical protein
LFANSLQVPHLFSSDRVFADPKTNPSEEKPDPSDATQLALDKRYKPPYACEYLAADKLERGIPVEFLNLDTWKAEQRAEMEQTEMERARRSEPYIVMNLMNPKVMKNRNSMSCCRNYAR